MEKFEVDITRWVDRAKGKMAAAPPAIAHALAERLKDLTPVATGNLRAGWQVEQIGPTNWAIVNNVAYAARINFGFVGEDSLGRYYDQKGYHMVEQVILEAPTIAKQAIDQL